MAARRAALSLAATVSVWSCTLLSGADHLQKVQCADLCDASAQGADAAGDDASPDRGGPATDGAQSGDGPPGDGSTDTGSAVDSGTDSGSTSDSATGDADASSPTSAYAAAVMADSPAGYWRLGDSASSATCHDASGHGHDGTLSGAVLLGVPGGLTGDTDTAAQFDGSMDHIDLGNAFDYSGAAPFSWEIWLKPTVLDGTYRSFLSTMLYDGQGGPSSGTYMLAYAAGGNTFGFERYDAGSTVIALETPGFAVGKWAHVVATTDASGDNVVYIDGAVVSSDTSTGSVPALTVETFIGQYFEGELDEVAIYDHALTAGAVLAHWKAGTTP